MQLLALNQASSSRFSVLTSHETSRFWIVLNPIRLAILLGKSVDNRMVISDLTIAAFSMPIICYISLLINQLVSIVLVIIVNCSVI